MSIGPADKLIEAAKNYQHPIGFIRMVWNINSIQKAGICGIFGRKLREMMPWIAKNKLVDKARN